MSLLDEAMLEGYRRGYRVTDDGRFLNPMGEVAGHRIRQGYMVSTGIEVPGHRSKVQFKVHRLAAYQWFGDAIFEKGLEVRHRNGNHLDNSKGNILLGTHSQNMLDRPKHERVAHARLAASRVRTLSTEQAQQLLDDRRAGATYKELCAKYGIPQSSVSYIVNGKTYPELKR